MITSKQPETENEVISVYRDVERMVTRYRNQKTGEQWDVPDYALSASEPSSTSVYRDYASYAHVKELEKRIESMETQFVNTIKILMETLNKDDQ